MNHSQSFDIEAAVPLEENEDGDSSDEENEDGDSSAEESTEVESIVSSMLETLNALSKRRESLDQMNGPTIFRVPTNYRKNKEHYIEPSVVSIGPYHHGTKRLEHMEDKKWLLLLDMLSECNKKVTLKACAEKIKGLQLQARNCYSERVDMDDDSFVKMLILDGTFIIQYFVKPYEWLQSEIGWASTCVDEDLILLENQIPFFVIQSLWDFYGFDTPLTDPKVLKEVASFLCNNVISGNTIVEQKEFHHLLHLCHHYLVPDMSTHVTILSGCSCFDFCKCLNSKHENPNKLPGATELRNAGIKFRKKKSSCRTMDVTFQGGKLQIPSVDIYDNTKPLIINLIAFEQSQDFSVPRHLTSYASFMDSIINTEHDVAILQRHGIIGNHLSGEEEVALFFNQLCIGTCKLEGHYLSGLVKEVNRYCDSKYHRNRAKLMRDYFNSPWSLISFIAAVIILGLTFAQTYFAGSDFFHPSPK